ncbi:MAG: hypothetical protein H7320_15045, partial [Ferruginibacter sp.]|nr:hypothetical protein [Ferruginibacter sp.]
VNNALKYSKARNLTLQIEAWKDKFDIRLIDDGIGFDKQAIDNYHYGLQIMQNRAIEAGFLCEVTTSQSHGTTICVTGTSVAELIQMNY